MLMRARNTNYECFGVFESNWSKRHTVNHGVLWPVGASTMLSLPPSIENWLLIIKIAKDTEKMRQWMTNDILLFIILSIVINSLRLVEIRNVVPPCRKKIKICFDFACRSYRIILSRNHATCVVHLFKDLLRFIDFLVLIICTYVHIYYDKTKPRPCG